MPQFPLGTIGLIVMKKQGTEEGSGVQLRWSCWLQCAVDWMLCRVPGCSEYCSEQLLLVQPPNRVWFSATPWTAAHQASLFLTISLGLFKLISMESVIPSNHVTLCCPLLLLPSIFPSIRVFSNESALQIRWPKYWSFSISPSNEYSGLIFFVINQFDLAVLSGSLKSLLQHHNLKVSILQHSAFFMVQLHICTWLLEKPYLWLQLSWYYSIFLLLLLRP